MKYYIIAGEASGDLHGSNLMYALKHEDPEAEFRIWGGDKMEAAGGHLVMHYRDIAYMGFVEVARNLRAIFRNLKQCREDILKFHPDALILIDYPGFNMRIANWCSQHAPEIKVFYYISPQVWAWKAKRALKLKATVDQMFVILPFEKEFYRQYDFDVTYVGHPLLDELESIPKATGFREKYQLDDRPIIAILPGSRKQEITAHLWRMLKISPQFQSHQWVVAGVSSVPERLYESAARGQNDQYQLVIDDTRALLQHAEAAIVASGTATLETALMGIPQVICYRGGHLSYQIAKRLIKVPYISLVNLILNREAVKELIQYDFQAKKLRVALADLFSPAKRKSLSRDYAELRKVLGGSGASTRAAKAMVSDIIKSK